jgi:hypothetical protein
MRLKDVGMRTPRLGISTKSKDFDVIFASADPFGDRGNDDGDVDL